MTSKRPQIYILCEDKNHYYFARKYFELLGIENILGKYNPKGEGSGADFVTKSYEKRFKAFRYKAGSFLVVIIDDDTRDRIQDLYNIYKPSKNENILIFSPKRNIESWFHFIETGDMGVETHKDEKGKLMDYKSKYKSYKPTEFAKKLKEDICQKSLPEHAPSSLHHACNELKRLNN
ncbi:MAG: hypothetical protein NTV43_10770 [Methylococcales bacterium]|nr:hypothetical protein [Methylococcales bacterium]